MDRRDTKSAMTAESATTAWDGTQHYESGIIHFCNDHIHVRGETFGATKKTICSDRALIMIH